MSENKNVEYIRPGDEDYEDYTDSFLESGVRARGWKMRFAAIFALLAVLIFMRNCSCEDRDRVGGISEKLQQVRQASEVLGELAARKCPGGKILILTEPEWSADYRKELVKAVEEGLSNGLGDGGEIAARTAPVFPESLLEEMDGVEKPGEGSSWVPPVESWFTVDVLREVLSNYRHCDALISMVGLPGDFDRSFFEDPRERLTTALAVVTGPLPGAESTVGAFGREVLIGAVIPCHGQTDDLPDGITREKATAFAAHSCLVTRENVKRIVQEHPEFFLEN